MSEPVSRKQRFPLPDSASVIAQARARRQDVRVRLHPSTSSQRPEALLNLEGEQSSLDFAESSP